MQHEDKHILWQTSAMLLGMSLPAILIGKGLLYGFLLLGVITGLMATKDESLRATVKLMQHSRLSWLLLLWLAVLLVGVLTGIDVVYALDKWGQLVLGVLVLGLLFMVLREMPGRHVELLLKVLAIATMSAAGLSLLDALLGNPQLSAALHGADKALTPYRLNFMSSALAVLLPFVWARLWLKASEGEPFAQRVLWPVAALTVLVAIVCGGRAGWVGLAVALAVFVALAVRYHGLRVTWRHGVLGVVLVGVSLVIYGFSFGWDFMWQRATIVGEVGVGRGMLSGRLEVWEAAARHLLDQPLFGIGVMNYRNLADAVDMHPHNWLLQMLLETGMMGTAVFVVMMVLVAKQFWNFGKVNIYGAAGLASLVAFLTTSLANTSIFNLHWLAFLMLPALLGWRMGFASSDLKKRKKGRLVTKLKAEMGA